MARAIVLPRFGWVAPTPSYARSVETSIGPGFMAAIWLPVVTTAVLTALTLV